MAKSAASGDGRGGNSLVLKGKKEKTSGERGIPGEGNNRRLDLGLKAHWRRSLMCQEKGKGIQRVENWTNRPRKEILGDRKVVVHIIWGEKGCWWEG